MSETDLVKETIAYLKFWLGVLVVTDVSLVGWLLTHVEQESDIKKFGAIPCALVIAMAALFIHERIQRLINRLEDL